MIGLLGKWVAPGDSDSVPLWATVLCGVGGFLLGNCLYVAALRPAHPRRRLVAPHLAGRRGRDPGAGARRAWRGVAGCRF